MKRLLPHCPGLCAAARALTLGALCLLGPGPASAAQEAGAAQPAEVTVATVTATAQQAQVRRGLNWLDAHRDHSARQLADIGAIIAPSGQEQERAHFVAGAMRAAGLVDVRVSPVNNVVGRIAGTSGKALVFVSTLDDLATVAQHQRAAAHPPRVSGERVVGPGSNTSLTTAALLAAAGAWQHSGLKPRHDIVFAAVAGEETGLLGMRELYRDYRERAIGFVDVLGEGEVIEYGGIGIHWWRVTARGEGGHTLEGGTPNINQAIGRAVDRLLQLPLPAPVDGAAVAWLNVAVLDSGAVFNHRPETGWFSLDVRALEAGHLAMLEDDVRRTLAAIEAELPVSFALEAVSTLPPGQIAGARESQLVRSAEAVSHYLGSSPRIDNRGSSNMNIAVAGGTPAIQIGSERGGRRGYPQEWADIPTLQRTSRHVFLLSVILGGAAP
ncbi:M20/M25/M40 family metallo-hydrolase [Parahaliea mediterranea]|uniref:M20/M25/M40 family metallo-hydrolase n=1 Tax=Parahaliea mediterranea TaxID=651086 RepID=UPI000E2EF09A|nr:M20/M25/M40 family metallo-hydrolase [Parahaliea mediterranea]